MHPDTHEKLLASAIQKEYKKSSNDMEDSIRIGDKNIATKLNIADRVDISSNAEAFITLKDHKDNFASNPDTRLLNPNKSNMAQISKQILEKINSKVRNQTELNQWQST